MIKIFEISGRFKEYHFLRRINRFVIETEEGDLCHLHDPGRLNELLIKGSEIQTILKEKGMKCEVISVKNNGENVFVNSKYHSPIAENLIKNGLLSKGFKIKRKEIVYKNNRLDFLLDINGEDYFLEVKGCTLLHNNIALFPDAPTVRGTNHIRDLIELKNSGKGAGVLFLVFRNAEYFGANYGTDMDFYLALKDAFNIGVDIFPVKLFFNGKELFYVEKIPLKLNGPAGI